MEIRYQDRAISKIEFVNIAEKLRFDLALSHKQFADNMGVNMAAYVKWTKGYNEPGFLSMSHMIKYMKSMEIPVDVVIK